VFLVLLLTGARVAPAAPAPGADRLKDNLYGVKFVDADHGWVVGAFGAVFRTVDGGKSWQPQVSHTTEMLFDVDFADAKNGWIVGRSGTILHTTDGGENWTKQSGTDKHLFAVDFVDGQYGVTVGDWGVILSTSDGGQTWASRSLENDVILNDVAMIDRSHGFLVGELGTIMKTEDGGATWQTVESGIQKSLFGVAFSDARNGWAVGIDAIILQTEDGGATWERRNGSVEVRELEQVGFAQALDNPSLYAVAVSGNRGFAAGEIGAVMTSEDGGRTWQRKPSRQDEQGTWFRGVSLAGTNGAIVGAKGERLLIKVGVVVEPGPEEPRAAPAAH
jgi:photosystem II stability/assembly factor-like uncharacterized protein